MDLNKFFQFKMFRGAVFGLAAIIILLAAFKLGTMVGFRKADFSCRWSDNYHQNFGGPRRGIMEGFGDRDFIEANGTVGQIIKIDGSTLIIQGQGDTEKIVIVNKDTAIRRLQDNKKISDLKINEKVVIIGEPNSAGQIEAKFIRVLPEIPPPSFPPNFPR